MQREIIKIKPDFYALPVIKKVAAYVRVSSGKDAMLHSLSAQISYYSAYIQKNPQWEYAGVYVDEARTGTKDTRIEFQRLLSDCKQGKIDMIVTKSISRFARNTLTVLETVRELKNLGIDVYFEKENIHSLSEDGELMLTLLSSFAQEESLSVSENCKWRIRDKFKRGVPFNSRTLGYIYENGNFEVDFSEAKIVRMIFEDYLNGMGMLMIARKLEKMKIKPRHSTKWNKNSVRTILQNEKYTGDLILQKTFIKDHISKKHCINKGELPKYYVEKSHEPIIDKDTFLRAQDEITKRAKKYSKGSNLNTYAFTSKIKCNLCGKNYNRKIAASGTRYEKPVWICSTFNTYGKKHCPSSQIPEEILETISAEVLGISHFDKNVFEEKIKQIIVPNKGELRFIFKDDSQVTKTWNYPSRSESWTPEMKQLARENKINSIERSKNFESSCKL